MTKDEEMARLKLTGFVGQALSLSRRNRFNFVASLELVNGPMCRPIIAMRWKCDEQEGLSVDEASGKWDFECQLLEGFADERSV